MTDLQGALLKGLAILAELQRIKRIKQNGTNNKHATGYIRFRVGGLH